MDLLGTSSAGISGILFEEEGKEAWTLIKR
jgi:hypothetical protein